MANTLTFPGAVYPGYQLNISTLNTTAAKQIQQRLIQLGFGTGLDASGTFGEKTKAAVIKFQTAKLLEPDGIVGPLTWFRLFNEPLVVEPVAPSATGLSLRAWEIALQQLHVREKTGKNDGKEVEMYLSSVHLTKGFAWCAAFLYWCFSQAAAQLNIANPVPPVAGVLELYRQAKKYQKSKKETPKPGWVGVFNYGEGKGHIFLIGKVTPPDLFTVEGNTNSASSREGDGVYNRNRSTTSSLLEGYLDFG